MADYIIQKAVEPAKVKVKLRRTLEDYGLSFEAQPKRDGCCAVLTLTGCNDTSFAQSRTGEPCMALMPAVRYLNGQGLAGLVLIGEAWWPGKDQFNLISGEFRRHRESDKLGLIINDALTLEEFSSGRSEEGYSARMDRLPTAFDHDRYQVTPRFMAASYGDPQALCNRFVDEGGHDGLILRDPSGKWTRGRGTTGEIVKIKRSLSFDLRVTAVDTVTGEKTGRDVYKLVVDFGGKPLGVGSGLPHDFDRVPKVGQIVEVEAMDYSSDGLLREPRYKGIRFDKLEPDTVTL